MNPGALRKYEILKNILDEYVREGATVRRRKSFFSTDTEEKSNQARARAFIHLYLAAIYGVLDFEERENIITDAGGDGGIDAYYINTQAKEIDIIQSKFRIGATNFESKFIAAEEIASIEVDRIMSGNTEDRNGSPYNGYIQAFIQKIGKISDIARYKIKITVLANVKSEHYLLVEKLFPGDVVNIFNFERCYGELVLPTLRGEQHYSSSLKLQMDLSNNSGNSRLNAEIETAYGACDLTVILVPTAEIAEIVSRYKNSLLRYNPRSYLEFREQKTNSGIRGSIEDIDTGDFAILNNGITIISDETFVNERIGARNKAQVELVNPQIINGGQTAFTLSRLFEEYKDTSKKDIFAGKEVTVRVIALPQVEEEMKKELIRSISFATNSQTAVSVTDRTASNDENRNLAEAVFLKTGLLYEPKRGEYFDSISRKYIRKSDIIDRTLFTRLFHVASGNYKLGITRKLMKNTGGIISESFDDQKLDRLARLYDIFKRISGERRTENQAKIVQSIAVVVFIDILTEVHKEKYQEVELSEAVSDVAAMWDILLKWAKENLVVFNKTGSDPNAGLQWTRFEWHRWISSDSFPRDVRLFAETLSH